MSNIQAAYDLLAEQLQADGLDVEAIKTALKQQQIETPSWGYANSGTRFKAFAWPGAATTTQQKLDDAAMVHKLTGVAPTVAIHIPWDKPADEDYTAMGQYAKDRGVAKTRKVAFSGAICDQSSTSKSNTDRPAVGYLVASRSISIFGAPAASSSASPCVPGLWPMISAML